MPWYENRSGEKLWYEDRGAGCPVVLVHGWCMSSAVWKYQFDGLAASVRLIAPDLRGHGHSKGIATQMGFDGFVNDLADLFNELDLSGAVLAGWSMGAQIALQAYAELSGRLAGLVLVSATPCFTVCDGFAHGLSASEARGMRLKVERNIRRALDGFHSRLFTKVELENHPSSPDIQQILAQIELPDTAAALDALDALAGTDMRPLLAGIDPPVLIVNGAEDQICLPQASCYLSEHIAGAEHIVFPGCGHVPFLTRSHQFNDGLTRFCKEHQ
jgi:pimeloyl-[acyl-carrier protein] methyl ester esterase